MSSGYFVYVSASQFDKGLFIGHVMHQFDNAGNISQRASFSSRSYDEARTVAQLIADYLNEVN